MDARYRELERLASLGDREAISALRQARLRRGEGINFGLWAPLVGKGLSYLSQGNSACVVSSRKVSGVSTRQWLYNTRRRHLEEKVEHLIFIRTEGDDNMKAFVFTSGHFLAAVGIFVVLFSDLRVFMTGWASEVVFREYISARRSLHGVPLAFVATDGLVLEKGEVGRYWPDTSREM